MALPTPIEYKEYLEPLREVVEPVSEPKHFGAKLLMNIWNEREADGGFVVGKDVPARRIAPIMHNLMLFEPMFESGRLRDMRVRIAGDSLRMRFDRDTTGKLLSDLFKPNDFESHIALTDEALRKNAPLFLRSELRRSNLVEKRLEIVVLPAWNANRTERWVLVGVFYFH